ncbi:hypothetical protein [Fischerella muscicola]|uniref:hypothetical protein n=1 Tax=Fischerella muscicola TaxID=92938 RepID=UPI0011AF7504|nr:hypothetical protein [Fischerella muscicola]
MGNSPPPTSLRKWGLGAMNGECEECEECGESEVASRKSQVVTTNQCTDVPWHVWYNNQQPTTNNQQPTN